MKHLKILLVVLCLIFLNTNILFSQTVKYKFGKLNKGEAEMKYYEKDSSASAVILYDKGYSYFEYDNNKKDFKINFKRNLRIKFFKKDAMEYANVEIPYYVGSNGNEELVTRVKGRTFNIVNGKVEVKKINKQNVFYEKDSEHWRTAKISFPDVKEGSVIDLEYSISSDFYFNLRGWQFQYKIPVKYSEYSVLIPEYFKYNRNQIGYENIFLNETDENRNEQFAVEYRTPPGQGGQIEKGTIYFDSNSSLITWKAKDIPAFVTEPYITTAKNYMTSLNFELMTRSYPQQPVSYYTTSWKDVDKKLLNNPYLGKQLKATYILKSKADLICKELNTKNEKIEAIYYWINKNIKWNGENSIFITEKLNDVLNLKTGNAADINMLLITMLKSQGINVNPILLSTRDHGMIFPAHPSMSAFNYLIAEVHSDDKLLYLDATDENLPLGMLPFRCLNGTGRRIGTADAGEVTIKPAFKNKKSFMYTVNIKPDESVISGSFSATYKEYAAYNKRKEIIKKGGEDEYISKLNENSENDEITNIKLSGFNEISKPIKQNYNFETSDYITFAGNMVYLSPLLNNAITDNPFKLEDRKYPVDYGYPYEQKVIIQYVLPDGYQISEKPENTSFSLPGRTAQYQYQISAVGNMVQVISIFKINKPVFQYDSYKALKNFYDLVIKKQNEKIVLSKK